MLMTRQRHRVEDLNVITNPYNIYPLINIYNIMGEKLLPNFGAKISALIYYFTHMHVMSTFCNSHCQDGV